MKNAIGLVFGLVIIASGANAQIYKCAGAGGKVEIQQAPCAGAGEKLDVRPASGRAAPVTNATDSGGAQQGDRLGQSQKETYSKAADTLRDERIRREGWQDMNFKKIALNKVIAQCQAEQRLIESEKDVSSNNQAGATRDVSISSKMQAAATICDGKARRAEKEWETATAQCEKIKCISPQ